MQLRARRLRDRLKIWIASLLAIMLLVLSACASLPAEGASSPDNILEFENASPDAVHVFLAMGTGYFRLGRVESMRQAQLRTPMKSTSISSVVVVPVGSLGAFRSSTQGAGSYASETYTVADLITQKWSFSGTRIMSIGPARR